MSLFNPRALKSAIGTPGAIPPKHLEILSAWAESIYDTSIYARNEIQLEGDFKSRIMETVLGYAPFGAGRPQTIQAKQQMGKGIVDLALGRFDAGTAHIIAPFELKGADTRDLDAPMPGRKITPVEQAWRYANSVAGVKWVLVTNFVELRLYAFGESNQVYDTFNLAKLTDPVEYARFRLVLSAENLLDGPTLALLDASRKADKEVSDKLYTDYKILRGNLIAAVNSGTGGKSPVQAISTAQKILDRVLFIAFAEDSLLLPKHSIKQAYDSRDLYNPRPIWHNFRALFTAIDKGNSELKIQSYNGGLFKADPAIDGIELPDEICEGFQKLGEYDFESEVGVTILGHIFEQSVADIERLQAVARGEVADEEKKTGTSGRRKRDGIVYTPDYIARFIVEKTLGSHIDELFWASMAKFATGHEIHDYEALKFGKQRGKGEALKNELQAWNEYRSKLQLIRVVDPACGSGVFLVTAFDFLRAEYDRVNKKIRELRGEKDVLGDVEDVDREILSQNLYGVDVNEESVELTKLSLWLKTARKGKKLDSLDHTIRVGDSLIEDSNYAYLKHGFEWRKAFPEVYDAGGFDVVLGNPPYVRMELIKNMKPWLKEKFEIFESGADLYCYFFERGLRQLKPNGRLGYICSCSFLKATFGKKLRDYISKCSTLSTVVDFGDETVFENVTTYPNIFVMQNIVATDTAVEFAQLGFKGTSKLKAEFENLKFEKYPSARLFRSNWHFESERLWRLRDKMQAANQYLFEKTGKPFNGIKTGFTEAFVLNETDAAVIRHGDENSSELLRNWMIGDDVERWAPDSLGKNTLLLVPKGITNSHLDSAAEFDPWSSFATRYPSAASWLSQHQTKAQKRSDKGDYWWELRACDYYAELTSVGILYPEMSQGPKFALKSGSDVPNNKTFFIASSDASVLAYLNSKACWFLLSGICSSLRGGQWRLELRSDYLEQLVMPDISTSDRGLLASKAKCAIVAAKSRNECAGSFRRRIPDLCPRDRDPKLNTKLNEWWTLPDFAAFRDEIKKHYRAEIPLNERTQWEEWFKSAKSEINHLSAAVARNEAEINTIVYRLFDLTPDEIKLLEDSLR